MGVTFLMHGQHKNTKNWYFSFTLFKESLDNLLFKETSIKLIFILTTKRIVDSPADLQSTGLLVCSKDFSCLYLTSCLQADVN